MSTVNYFDLAAVMRMPILAASYSNRNAVSETEPSGLEAFAISFARPLRVQ
jgi:hypothetical protein